ncbi:hypothetical protein [Kitasatospora sp. NPDC050463]|uniref:hypothetical protein n=1 Tax=Kitasatospora sp. NPDC050463 TaxID=3155786 RepID=UPI0034093BAD
MVFAVAVVTALGALLIGPSRAAVAIRTACRRMVGPCARCCSAFPIRDFLDTDPGPGTPSAASGSSSGPGGVSGTGPPAGA